MANKSTLRARRSIRVTVTTSGGEVVEHLEKLAPVLEGDADFPGRWRAIKTAFSSALPAREWRSPAMTSRGTEALR